MKKLKTSLILLIAFLFLASCSQAAAEEIVPEYDSAVDTENIDLMGYEYTIAAETHGGGEYQLSPEPGANDRGDKLLQRYKDTEKKFNITLNVQNGSSLSTFVTQYAA